MLPSDGHVEDFRVEHDFEGLGRRVMLLNAHSLERADCPDSILLAIDDVTERERVRFELEGQKEFAEKIVDASRDALLILGWDLRVRSANETFYTTFKVDPAATEGRLVYELGNGQWDIPRLRELLEKVLPGNDAFDDFVVEHDFEGIGHRRSRVRATQYARSPKRVSPSWARLGQPALPLTVPLCHGPRGRGIPVSADTVPGVARVPGTESRASGRLRSSSGAPQSAARALLRAGAALKLRTTNKKGRHLSTARALELLEDYGVETPEGLVQAPKGLLKKTTVNRYLGAVASRSASPDRQPAAVEG